MVFPRHVRSCSLLSMLPVVVFLVGIYLANNPMARVAHPARQFGIIEINAAYLPQGAETQCWLALVMTAWIAPRLVSFDLADNALPILLSHPISRFGYVLGKFIALFACLSLVTWIPCTPVVCLPGIYLAAAMGLRQSPHRGRHAGWVPSSGLRCFLSSAWLFRHG